jgi:hypothetical protein
MARGMPGKKERRCSAACRSAVDVIVSVRRWQIGLMDIAALALSHKSSFHIPSHLVFLVISFQNVV